MLRLALSSGLVVCLLTIPAASVQDAGQAGRSADQHFKKALDLMKLTQYQDAILEYEKVVSLLPQSEIALDAQYWIGQSYFQMGEHDDALSIFKMLIQEYPQSAIAPVTQLMIARVERDKEASKARAKKEASAEQDIITDPKTGVAYHRLASLAGRKDVVDHAWALKFSPNGKYLLYENLVIPLDEDEPFNLVDMDAWRGIWSPDGKQAAFYTRGGPIWVVPVSPDTGRATGPPKKLVDVKFGWQAHVSWSSDSEKIVFFGTQGKFRGNIWTISVEDGELTQITDDPIFQGRPKMSPDGKVIAYNNSNAEIWTISAEGKNPRKIFGRGRPYSWSPDSKWIAISTPPYNEFRLLRLADGRVFDIDQPEGVGSLFSWSLDGKKLQFFRSSYAYSCDLKVVSTSGGPSFELGRELELWPYIHYWSPDSKMIITEGSHPIAPEYRNDLDFWMVPLAGGEAQTIDLDIPGMDKPHPRSLSPDCKRLLVFEDRGEGKEDLYVVPVSLDEAGTTGPAILVFKGRDKKPVGFGRRDEWSWSPDGNKIALVHAGDIWVTSADKGEPVNITQSPQQDSFPVWSPDGRMIACRMQYDEKGGEKHSLHIIPVSGEKEMKILDMSVRVTDKEGFDWSPDGKELAVISEGKISVVPISGGKAREIFDLEAFGVKRVIALSWLPDGKHFAFIGEKEDECRMFLVSDNGDKVTELAADDKNWKDWLYPSPDGKWISYDSEGEAKVRSQGTIWEVDFDEFIKAKAEREHQKKTDLAYSR
jgi:Tol biopolymer transport system component